MECWNDGMLEWWNGRMMEWQNGGMVEWWNGGIFLKTDWRNILKRGMAYWM